jgi:hypothetical protein
MTLRPPPPLLDATLDEDPSTPLPKEGWRAPSKPDNSLLIVGGFAFMVLVLLVVLVMGAARNPVATELPTVIPSLSPLPTITPIRETVVVTVVPPTAVLPSPTATPDCVSGQAQLALIEAMEKKSNWKQAAATAEAALDLPTLCEADRRALTQKAVADGLNVLYYTAVDGQDRTGQQHAVDTYLALKQRARDAHVDFPSPLQVATQALLISQFRLAIAAVEIAYAQHDFDPSIHRDISHLYVSALYSIGLYYSKAPQGSDLYIEGLGYLSASHRLAVQYQTGQGEAATLLSLLIGSNEATWPKPYQSPLLTP